MSSPRKSTVEGKSKGLKRELGLCCHSGTGERVSSLDTGGRGRGRNGGDPGVELLLRPSSTEHGRGPGACEPRKRKGALEGPVTGLGSDIDRDI